MTRRDRAHAGVAHLGVLVLLAVAEFMLTLDLSIVNVALPSIRAALGFGAGSLQWVVNAYALAFAGFLLCGGRAADLVGGRRVFLGALGAFSAASLAAGLAASQGALIAARAVQGLSAGVLSPATLSILTSTYRADEERSRALSVWTAVAIGGGATGGLIGGVLVSALTWRWIFFVNVPVGALLAGLAARRLPGRAVHAERGHLDLSGAVLATTGVSALVWALVRSTAAGWGAAQVLGGLLAAALLLGAFALVETHWARTPLVPFGVFRSRRLSAGNLLSFLSFVPVMATWFFLTLYLQSVRGYSPAQAGVLFLPVSLAVIAGSQMSFRLVAGIDARALFAAGGLIGAAGLAWLGRLAAGAQVVWVIVPACVAMLGGGLMFAPVTIAATAGVGPDQGGLASGLLNTTRQLGGVLGLAVLGTIAARAGTGAGATHAASVSDGFGAALTVGAAIFCATAVIGVTVLPRQLRGPPALATRPR